MRKILKKHMPINPKPCHYRIFNRKKKLQQKQAHVLTNCSYIDDLKDGCGSFLSVIFLSKTSS